MLIGMAVDDKAEPKKDVVELTLAPELVGD